MASEKSLIIVALTVAGALVMMLMVSVLPGRAAAVAPVTPPVPVPTPIVPVPAPRTLPAAMDVAQQYEGQSICDPVAKPGVLKLQALLRATYGPATFYSTRACAADPTSEHTEGRALDWMVNSRVPVEKAKAEALIAWLLAPDASGVPGANARRMGIMYVIWNNLFWRAYDPIGWSKFGGCSAKARASEVYDTTCHRNHIHFSMTWDGAAALTSYWDGTAQTQGYCPSSFRGGKVPRVPAPLVAVPLPEATIFDTRTGRGNSRRICRMEEDRWAGDGHKLDVKVAGKGRVPGVGAYWATLRVTAVDPNAPMAIFAWPTGKNRPGKPTLTTTMNSAASVIVDLRIGAGGYVSIATNTGDTNVAVSVLGYRAVS